MYTYVYVCPRVSGFYTGFDSCFKNVSNRKRICLLLKPIYTVILNMLTSYIHVYLHSCFVVKNVEGKHTLGVIYPSLYKTLCMYTYANAPVSLSSDTLWR